MNMSMASVASVENPNMMRHNYPSRLPMPGQSVNDPSERVLAIELDNHGRNLIEIEDALDRTLVRIRGAQPREVPGVQAAAPANEPSLFAISDDIGRTIMRIADRARELAQYLGAK